MHLIHKLPGARPPSLRHLPRNLHFKSSKLRHNRSLLLLHPLATLHSIRQHPQIIYIIRRRKRIKELRFLLKRITERMNRLRRDDDVVAGFGVDDAFVGCEADPSFRYEEGLVVHAVPVQDWAGGFAGDGEGHGADAVVGVAAVFEDADWELCS